MADVLLSLQNVSKRFGGLLALNDVTFDVPQGMIYGVIGPNGAGKTSLFNCITSFGVPTSGRIALQGERIDGLTPHVIARRGIARTYQNVRLFQDLSALDNVVVGQHMRLNTSFLSIVLQTRAFKEAEREARERARDILAWIGLEGREEDEARNLSYGDQRRLEIARALIAEPQILLLDEPAAGMNPAESAVLARVIRDIRDRLGVTILLIEHHMDLVMSVCDRISVLDRGAVIANGTPGEIQSNQRVIDAYLGKRKSTQEELAAMEASA